MENNEIERVTASPGSREPSPSVSAVPASIPRAVQWSNPKLGSIYAVIERERDMTDGSEWTCLNDAMKEIEQADVHRERRIKEAAE